jgi:hypothetical protein
MSGRQADFALEQFDRIDQEKGVRRALEESEAFQAKFFAIHGEGLISEGFLPKQPLTPAELELSVVLNMLWETLELAAYRESEQAEPDSSDYPSGYAAGLHWAARPRRGRSTEHGVRGPGTSGRRDPRTLGPPPSDAALAHLGRQALRNAAGYRPPSLRVPYTPKFWAWTRWMCTLSSSLLLTG